MSELFSEAKALWLSEGSPKGEIPFLWQHVEDASDAIFMHLIMSGEFPPVGIEIPQNVDELQSIMHVDVVDLATQTMRMLAQTPDYLASGPEDTKNLFKIVHIINGLGQIQENS